ncbi:hypothetical protein EDC01DRAFT_731012 [Geopyxis carbonaria]|nr:hypothetical protein EDC01DRAFT_731012 [Geopyxis carbonaria]
MLKLLLVFLCALSLESYALDCATCNRTLTSMIDNGNLTTVAYGNSTFLFYTNATFIANDTEIDVFTKSKTRPISTRLSPAQFWDLSIGERRKITIFNSEGEEVPGITFYLELPHCKRICGSGWTPFETRSIVTRIGSWLLPVLLLIGNMALADLGFWKGIAIVVHGLGDPIDTMWSLLTTLELRRRGSAWALMRGYDFNTAAAVGDLFALVDETGGGGSRNPNELPMMLEEYQEYAKFAPAVLKVAEEIRDSRANDTTRTVIAVVAYLANIATAFLSAFKYQVEKPGNRIAYASLFVWLVPATLLSAKAGKANSIGCFPRIMRRFDAALRGVDEWSLPQTYATGEMQSLWGGAVYTFRPSKTLFHSAPGDGYRQPWILFLLAALYVVISACIATTVSWLSPEPGFKCKTLSIVLISVGWIFSAIFTSLVWRCNFSRIYATRFILLKDTFISITAILVVFLSSIGVLNSCYCNSGYPSTRQKAGVELEANYRRAELLITLYPVLVLTNLGTLLVLAVFCLWLVAVRDRTENCAAGN